ncbi:hypothetical protein CRE_05698 [Caenorhabditis remanei]|uniref:Serpentine receptor class gamma n=1 Tax=Caenorhabditis remanei TaxID=31234 RepID=E3LZL2_CAERE|nr:hypothetical protein CRE_05698 [Caenorhabditis remanei]
MGISDVVYCCSVLISEFIHYTQSFPKFIFVCFVVIPYYGVFFNHLANMLLSINRFCATCVWYNTHFDAVSIKKYFLVIAIISLIFTLPGGILMFVYLFMDWGTQAQYSRTGISSFNLHRTIIISLTIIDTSIGISASIATVYRLKKYKFSYDKVRNISLSICSPSCFQSLLLITTLHIFPNLLVQFFNLDMMFQFSGNSLLSNELSRTFLIFLVSFNSLTMFGTNRKIRQEYIQMIMFWKERESVTTTSIRKISTATGAHATERVTVF